HVITPGLLTESSHERVPASDNPMPHAGAASPSHFDGDDGMTRLPTETDVLVVGAGPAGSSAAAWTARQGTDVVLADAATFPRDKTCGDGLTPRAIAELERLGLGD